MREPGDVVGCPRKYHVSICNTIPIHPSLAHGCFRTLLIFFVTNFSNIHAHRHDRCSVLEVIQRLAELIASSIMCARNQRSWETECVFSDFTDLGCGSPYYQCVMPTNKSFWNFTRIGHHIDIMRSFAEATSALTAVIISDVSARLQQQIKESAPV